MLNQTTDDLLYTALVERDPAFEGRAFVGVKTTGIFCRLTCPARKPKRENSVFYETAAECLEAGFRPCKRCRPMATAAALDPLVSELMDALEAEPSRRWREQDLIERGLDPSTVRRAFRRTLGATFLEIARLHRLRAAAKARQSGDTVIEAQHQAGFDSASGFRAAFAKLLGRAPGSFTGQEPVKADFVDTPLGPMIAVADDERVWLLEFADRKELPKELSVIEKEASGPIGLGSPAALDELKKELTEYFDGERQTFSIKMKEWGTPFSKSVWAELGRIPPGTTRSYGEMAKILGRPTAVRAVARANASNRLAILVPCHRVIGADGKVSGYAGGVWRKTWLLEHERRMATADKA